MDPLNNQPTQRPHLNLEKENLPHTLPTILHNKTGEQNPSVEAPSLKNRNIQPLAGSKTTLLPQTPQMRTLMSTAMTGQLELLKQTLALQTVPVDQARTPAGSTALMMAAMKGNVEVMRVLIDAGADVHARNRSGNTAFMLAAQFGQLDAMCMLTKEHNVTSSDGVADDGSTALMFAVQQGRLEAVRLILQEATPAIIDVRNFAGQTALMLAAHMENMAALDLLFKRAHILMYAIKKEERP